ncbi:MAG TPA: TIGR00730 family Rossman fold protein [Bacteroidales bacterium]|nr:TIGR00730 family Rossman fold protein [Bacteroidales bacterium]HPI86787.1 TIGR00730 family Rossman fold protein [Bacteroidales bacterium]HPM92900.1 TIGR00730 family Rossman fold protein [Bacteroidales bacterium]
MDSICVFCGSSMGKKPEYKKAAEELGRLLLERNIRLVYGGANVGLMQILADTVLKGGGEVIGIMPQMLIEKEVAHANLTKMITVGSMSERKSRMVELSDAFIAMPGGFGTLDELAEVITYNQLRLTDKPIGILNTAGYFDPLVAFFDHITEEGFLRYEHRQNLIVDDNVGVLLRKMIEFQPVAMDKWIEDIKKESL